jgi:hypothetical protein
MGEPVRNQRKPSRLGNRKEALRREQALALLERAVAIRESELAEIREAMGGVETWPGSTMRIHLDRWEMAELELLLARKAKYHHFLAKDVDIYSLPRNCYRFSWLDPKAQECIIQKSIERLPPYCYEARRLMRYVDEIHK